MAASSPGSQRVAIAGAGIGGLALATLLARAGHRVELFDRFETPAPVGAGLMLQETGLSVLGAMGLRGDAEMRGAPVERLDGRRASDGRQVLDVRFATLRPGLVALGIQRAALFGLLYTAAAEAGAAFTGCTEIAGADAHAGCFIDRQGRRLGPFDLIVDGMGVRSPLGGDGDDLAFGALWASLPWPPDGGFAGNALEQRYRNASEMAGLMPSGRATPESRPGLTYFWSLRVVDEPARRRAPFGNWKTRAAAFWPQTGPLLEALDHHDDLTFARYRHQTHPKPLEGRLARLGDSWHATSPQLGQGANMALLDAFALSAALTGDPDLALYPRLRRNHIRLYQTLSWLFTPVYQSESAILPVLRDRLAAPVSRMPPAPRLLAAMVSGAFGSPLATLGLRPRSHS